MFAVAVAVPLPRPFIPSLCSAALFAGALAKMDPRNGRCLIYLLYLYLSYVSQLQFLDPVFGIPFLLLVRFLGELNYDVLLGRVQRAVR